MHMEGCFNLELSNTLLLSKTKLFVLLEYDTGYFCIFVKYTFELILILRL